MARFARSAHPTDRGDVVLGWLTRIAVVLGVSGLALFDAISIGSTSMTVADDGSYAAREASENWQTTHSIQQAYNAAAAAAVQQNSANVVLTKGFVIDPDGTVHLRVARDAPTLVVFRFGATKKWAHVERQAVGRSVS